MGVPADGQCKLQITSILLFVKKVRVASDMQLGHAESLLTARTKYPIDYMGMKVFNILPGSWVSNQENLFWDSYPNSSSSGSWLMMPLVGTMLKTPST